MHGRLNRSTVPLTDVAPTVIAVQNLALREVTITNITENESITNNGVPASNIPAGGRVTVEIGRNISMNRDSDNTGDGVLREAEDALAVRWEPERERFWEFGTFFTVTFTEFGETEPKSFTVRDYINDDGTPKSLTELRSTTDNPQYLQRFIDDGARLELRDGAVRLILSRDPEKMPRIVSIEVEFLPTIGVRNITEDYVGGKVQVINGGELTNVADGVPRSYGGTPYTQNSVYGIADPGYKVDKSRMLVRNLYDLDAYYGYVLIEPNDDGTFEAVLRTNVAGVYPAYVEITGTVIDGSIEIVLDSLPVPLQIDLHFIPESVGDGGSGDGDSSKGDSGDDSDTVVLSTRNQGGLPRTGVESILWLLILGLLTSLAATCSIIFVIRYQNTKEKR